SADRKYVQLDRWPQVVNIRDFTDFSLGTTGAFISLPEVTSQDIRTTVSVPDGGTVLLGGLKKLTEHDVETGVPILSKFRFLSRLFSNRASLSAHSNLIILVTPRVIIQAEQEDKQTGQ
ncbi:MAG: hypothetical protein QGD94_00980, partial [Planctomycetia bacterium]|nr:hypothetical protein [Planctomycetia bacterium]